VLCVSSRLIPCDIKWNAYPFGRTVVAIEQLRYWCVARRMASHSRSYVNTRGPVASGKDTTCAINTRSRLSVDAPRTW
jgi:hypothetical protein